MKQQFCLINDKVKRNVVNFIQSLPVDHRSPLIIEAREESRTDKQNRLMWPLLKDLSDQVIWYGEKLEPVEWKDLITVPVSQMQNPECEQKSARGINGGRVYFVVRSSQFSKRYMVEVIEAIYWFGTEHNVKFSEKSRNPAVDLHDREQWQRARWPTHPDVWRYRAAQQATCSPVAD